MMWRGRHNNGMHPTRDTNTFINLGQAGGRVMPGVRLLQVAESMKEMGRVKKSVVMILMLAFMVGGGVLGMMAFLRLVGQAMDTVSNTDYLLLLLFFCFLMLSFFVGLCLGTVLWMLAMRPFVSKEHMYEEFISDPKFMYPRGTELLENLLELIY